MINSTVHNSFKENKSELDHFIANFESLGIPFGNQDRNSLKLFKLKNLTINVKSFRVPNIINQMAYKFFRKSKAQRSFEYANKLTQLGIGTPRPIAFYENNTPFLFKNSYYVSEQLDCDLTFRELITDLKYPNHENILRAFTRFTFNLHEKGINFLDHSPGNTLIKKNGSTYYFYLVDLNRMNFGVLDFKTRIKNFARLTEYKQMVEVMSDEYAKCIDEDYEKVFTAMWREVQVFRTKFNRKKELKKKFKL